MGKPCCASFHFRWLFCFAKWRVFASKTQNEEKAYKNSCNEIIKSAFRSCKTQMQNIRLSDTLSVVFPMSFFFFFLIYPKQLLELVVELTYFHLRSLIPCDSAVTIPILLFQQFHPWLVQESELILYSGLLKRWSGSEPSQLSGMAVYFWASQAFYHASHKNINNNNKSNKKISYIFSSLVALKHNLWHLLLTSFITEAIKNCCLPIFDHLLLLISHQV